jgi:hypothetical protein
MIFRILVLSIVANLVTSFALANVTKSTAEELNGMSKLDIGCSGALISVPGRGLSGKAVVLTNGHCARDPILSAEEILINKPYLYVVNLYSPTQAKFINMGKGVVLYATLKDTDLAIIELNKTYKELLDLGIKTYVVATDLASKSSSITIVSGRFSETQKCKIERYVYQLIEGFENPNLPPSVATNAIALSSECKLKGGYSGSPIILDSTQQIVAVASTSNGLGTATCAEGNPCEKSLDGLVTAEKNRGYGTRVNDLPLCFDQKGDFDLQSNLCNLPK